MAEPHFQESGEEPLVTDLDTYLIGGALILQAISTGNDLWGVRRKRRETNEAKPEFLRDWMSTRDPKKMQPYPDHFGNTDDAIRGAWKGATYSQWVFAGSGIMVWTIVLYSIYLGLEPPVAVVLVLAIISFAAMLSYRHYLKFLTHKKRRYILAHLAVWMGFPLRHPNEIEVPPEPRVQATVQQHRRAIRHERFRR